VPVARIEEVIRVVWDVKKRLKTMIVMGVGTRCDENGEDLVVAPVLERLGYSLERAKTNLGLGRAVLNPNTSRNSENDSQKIEAGTGPAVPS
jgi:hypothetical protein